MRERKLFVKWSKGLAPLIVLFAAISLLSCNKSHPFTKADIVGKWIEGSIGIPKVYTFNADGTGSDNWPNQILWDMYGDTIIINTYSRFGTENKYTYIAGEMCDTVVDGTKVHYAKLQEVVPKYHGYSDPHGGGGFNPNDVKSKLRERVGTGWLLSEEGVDWLVSNQGNEWLETEDGQEWLKTEEGKERFSTKIEDRIWLKYSDYEKIKN